MDPRARPLRTARVAVAAISDVRKGFHWRGPGVNHLVLASIAGTGVLEVEGEPYSMRPGAVVLSPAGLSRRLATRAKSWKFLAIRLADAQRWRHLRHDAARPLAGHWLGRLLAPVEGMLAEHPLGEGIAVQTPASQSGGEDALEYLWSRHRDRLVSPDSKESKGRPHTDPFAMHALILKRQIETMLAEHALPQPGDADVALASLWGRVFDRPRGPWDADDLASELGVSRTTLYRMVKSEHGSSPARVVERLRMEVACRLLTESAHSIEVIAEQVGYANAFSFSSAFKRVVGKPPSSFRDHAASRSGSMAR